MLEENNDEFLHRAGYASDFSDAPLIDICFFLLNIECPILTDYIKLVI